MPIYELIFLLQYEDYCESFTRYGDDEDLTTSVVTEANSLQKVYSANVSLISWREL